MLAIECVYWKEFIERLRKGEVMRIRYTKFELLRIVCMLFVIMEHLVPHINDMQNIYGGYYTGNIIRSFCIIAVNCFVLLSGYFGIKMKLKKFFN